MKVAEAEPSGAIRAFFVARVLPLSSVTRTAALPAGSVGRRDASHRRIAPGAR